MDCFSFIDLLVHSSNEIKGQSDAQCPKTANNPKEKKLKAKDERTPKESVIKHGQWSQLFQYKKNEAKSTF